MGTRHNARGVQAMIEKNISSPTSNTHAARTQPTQPVLFLLLFPTWAWKPLLIALTDRRLPHDSHAMKKIRFSFVSRVSGDLQVLQVTYSTGRERV